MTVRLPDGRGFVFVNNWWDDPDYMYDQALLNGTLAEDNLPTLLGFTPPWWLVRLTQRMASGWCVDNVERGGWRWLVASAVYSLPWV